MESGGERWRAVESGGERWSDGAVEQSQLTVAQAYAISVVQTPLTLSPVCHDEI